MAPLRCAGRIVDLSPHNEPLSLAQKLLSKDTGREYTELERGRAQEDAIGASRTGRSIRMHSSQQPPSGPENGPQYDCSTRFPRQRGAGATNRIIRKSIRLLAIRKSIRLRIHASRQDRSLILHDPRPQAPRHIPRSSLSFS